MGHTLKTVKGDYLPGRAARIDEGFATRLREAMSRRGVRPSQLARGLNVYAGTVSRWRKGECPDDLRMPEIAAYLRVALDWLKNGLGDMERREGEPSAPRSHSPGRRREDVELRSAALRHAAGRLDVLLRLIQAYKDAGRAASPEILAEWLEIAALNASADLTPPGGLGGGALPPMPLAAQSWHTGAPGLP
jgi:transcriptional regulator with XRE-family HTH domain